MAISEYSANSSLGGYEYDSIPVKKYPFLCGCVFCWSYHYTINCKKCNKLFCRDHKGNHFCFREIVVLSPVGAEPTSEGMEMVS